MKNYYIVLILILSSCKSLQNNSTLTADHYDANTNLTSVVGMPYGNIEIPGKWTQTSYNESSKQAFYRNVDSVKIAVAKQPREKYEFYEDNMDNQEFVIEFYKWDRDYFIQNGVNVSLLNKTSDYVIFKAISKTSNMTFLFGSKNNMGYNLCTITNKWTTEQCKAFLVDLYIRN